MKLFNAFCTGGYELAAKQCDRLIAAGTEKVDCARFFAEFDGTNKSGDVYLKSMLDEDLLEPFFDYVVSNDCKAAVRAQYDLFETGMVSARHALSPVMLLHKMGVIDRCTIVSGVCLDNDDLDLMAQEGVPLVLLPTADAGCGHGFAPVCAAVKRGVRVGVGTFDGRYNPEHSIRKELEFLSLVTSAEMRKSDVLPSEVSDRIARFE